MTDIRDTIIQSAFKWMSQDIKDTVARETWQAIAAAPRDVHVAAIKQAHDLAVIDISEYFNTADESMAKLLWNEFGEHITPAAVLEPWRKEIVDTPRAVRPAEMQWHTKRLRRANLPRTVARVQLGEIFGGDVIWGDVLRDVDVELTDTGGIALDCGYTFEGWCSERKIYLGICAEFESNDSAARIAL